MLLYPHNFHSTYKLVVAYVLIMADRRYTNLPFYGSTDPEEFLEWQEKMEIELEVQGFSESKKITRAVLEFEDYVLDWWKQYPRKRLVKNWKDLKKAMRKEFFSRKYGLIFLRGLENVKQGSKSVQAYYESYILPCIEQMLLIT